MINSNLRGYLRQLKRPQIMGVGGSSTPIKCVHALCLIMRKKSLSLICELDLVSYILLYGLGFTYYLGDVI